MIKKKSSNNTKIKLNYALILSGDSFLHINTDIMKKKLYDIA